MSDKLGGIIDSIADLSVLELSELVSALEEKFGVEAAAPMMMGAMPAAGGGDDEADEAPTSFNVILKEIGSSKIPVIKQVRSITGLGRKEARGRVDQARKAIKEGVGKAEAEDIKAKLEGDGATVEIVSA